MLVFSALKVGLTPEINALSALVLAVAALAVGLAGLILARRANGAG
jgi:putrescine transport system permease protein